MDSIYKEQQIGMGYNPEQTPNFTPKPELNKDEISERSFDLYRLYQMSQVRESALPQFDGMGYSRYNETNEMADISYLPPKKNKGDSRITTGITHEKDTSLVSFFLNLNFEGNVSIYYKDKEIFDLGTAITKLVRKSREQESYNQKRPIFYRNFVAQGTSFAREQYTEVWVPNKIITSEIDPTSLDKVKWLDKGYKKVMRGCETVLVDGKKVFLEDIRQPDIQKQPGVYTVEYVPREIMKGIWGDTERWKYVPYFVTPTAQALGTLTQGSIYSDWIFGEIDFNKVEVIQVYRPFEQRYQIYINGVPMLPARFPLQAVSPSGLIPIAKGDGDLMNMFAYSKSEPAKTKIDQAVFDEILQNMIVKFRQSTFVPRVNNSERVLTPDMFLGGRIISNISTKDVEPLIEQPGITNSDFSFYQLLKDQIGEKSISSILEGQAPGGDMTATQYMEQQKRAALKLGLKLDGIINWERDMLKLRTLNLLQHVYEKNDSGDYKDITMKDDLFSGKNGLSIIKFDNKNVRSPYQVWDEEQEYKQQNGQDVEFTYLNPDLMKQILTDPDYYIKYDIVPVDKNNDKLTQMMFVQMVSQAAALFGMESLQVDNLKKRYAKVMGEEFDDLFLSPEQIEIKQQQMMLQAQAGVDPAGGENPIANANNAMQPALTDVIMS